MTAGEFVLKDDGAWGLKSDGSWALFNASNECDECCAPGTTVECIWCVGDLASEEYQADISGVVNDFCTDCADVNGTWFLTPSAWLGPALSPTGGDDCIWIAKIPSPYICVDETPTPTDAWIALYTKPDGGSPPGTFWEANLIIKFGTGTPTIEMRWKKSFAPANGGSDCCEITDLDIPFLSDTGLCSGAASTFLLTSLDC